jgi:hypothetical protein
MQFLKVHSARQGPADNRHTRIILPDHRLLCLSHKSVNRATSLAMTGKKQPTVLQRGLLETVTALTPCVCISGFTFYNTKRPPQYNPNVQPSQYSASRFSNAPSEVSVVTTGEKAGTAPMINNTNTVPPYMWDNKDPDLDDPLHNPDPVRDAALDRSFTLFSARGWMNASALFILVLGLLILFAGYPIIIYARQSKHVGPGFNLGGINGSGQVPDLPHMPKLIDDETPMDARTRTGADGKSYNLVFSDEFNQDGRTFWPGDDPYWEAVNLHYWPTGDLEWYDPQVRAAAAWEAFRLGSYSLTGHYYQGWEAGDNDGGNAHRQSELA